MTITQKGILITKLMTNDGWVKYFCPNKIDQMMLPHTTIDGKYDAILSTLETHLRSCEFRVNYGLWTMEIQESSLRCDAKSAEAKITAVCLLNLTAEMVRKSDGNRQAISWNRYLHTRLHCCPRPWLASLVNNRGKVSQFISCSTCATCGTPLRRRSTTGDVLWRSTPVLIVLSILCCSFAVSVLYESWAFKILFNHRSFDIIF